MRQMKIMNWTCGGLLLGALILTGMGCNKTTAADTHAEGHAVAATPVVVTQQPATTPTPPPVVTPPTPPVITDEQLAESMQVAVDQGTFIDYMDSLKATEQLLDRGNASAQNADVIDCLLTTGAALLDDDANWTDSKLARRVYDLLKREPSQEVIEGMARKVMQKDNRRQLLYLGVKLGIPDSEQRLNSILRNHGDKDMAEDFLNSGSDELHEGARLWGEDRGYYIATGDGSHRTGWGDF